MGADAGCRKRHRDRGDQLGGKSRAGRRAGDHGNRRVRPHRRWAGRCGICGRRCPGYDQGERRRWRALDLGAIRAELEGAAPRVSCPGHSVTVAAVPWARHAARHTRAFEDTIAWLACAASKAAICELMRTGWRTIGHIITRVAAEAAAGTGRLAGPRRTGIDEISCRKGRKYLVVVVDHDTGLLIRAAPGRTMKAVASFFDALGPDRTAALTHVSADGASYIATVVSARAPAAIQCTDPFHVVSWAAEALDQVPPRSLAGRPRPARRQRPAPPRPPHHPVISRRRPLPQAHPLRPAEEPGQPHRQATSQARLDREDPPLPLPRLAAQRRNTRHIRPQRPARSRPRSPRQMAPAGRPQPHPAIRRARPANPQAPGRHPGLHRQQHVQRAHRISQYQGTAHHPRGIRIPRPPSPRRPGHAQPRWPAPRPPRPLKPPTEPAGDPQICIVAAPGERAHLPLGVSQLMIHRRLSSRLWPRSRAAMTASRA